MGKFDIKNSNFINNTARSDGGVITNIGDTMILNSTFTNNNSLSAGGAIIIVEIWIFFILVLYIILQIRGEL